MRTKESVIIILIFLVVITVSLALLSPKAAIVATICYTIAAITFFKPTYALIIYIAILLLKPQRSIPELAEMRIMLILAIFIISIYFIHKIARREKIGFFSTRQHILMFILLAIVPASNIINFRIKDSYEGFREFLTVFLLFFMITGITDNFKKFRMVCWTLTTCTVILAVNGLIQHFRGADLIGFSPVAGRIRGAGIFTDPNEFALLITTFLPFIIFNLFEKRTKTIIKLILILLGIACVTAVYYTNSRGGFISLIAALFFFSYKKWGLLKGFALGIVLIICALLLAPSRISEISLRDGSSTGRINAWITGLTLLQTRPVLGIGYNNFLLFNRKDAHSAFIKCFAEIGLIGYFVWLALIYTCWSDLGKVENTEQVSQYNKYAKILRISFIAFLSSAFFLSQTYSVVLYILVALTSVSTKNTYLTFKKQPAIKPKELIIISIVLLGSIFVFRVFTLLYI